MKDRLKNQENVNSLNIAKMTPSLLTSMYMTGSKHLLIGISKDDIIKKNLKYAKSFFDTFMLKPEMGIQFEVLLTTDAYDKDSRELFMIPEWKEFIEELYNSIPAMMMFLSVDSFKVVVFALCGEDITPVNEESYNVKINNAKLLEIVKTSCRYCEAQKLDPMFQSRFAAGMQEMIN